MDICIAGAGVIGLAIARQLARSCDRRYSIVLLDPEPGFGQHGSSRNSEVIHAGLYYPRNSLKARLCVRGKALLYDYCRRHDIPHRRLGKVIVAQEGEDHALTALQQQAKANGVEDLCWLDSTRLRQLEPAVRGTAALLSPSTGIIDSHAFMQSLLFEAESRGVIFARHTVVERVECDAEGFHVHTRQAGTGNTETYNLRCRAFVNSAGLQAQQLASRIECVAPDTIPPLHYCKGDYFSYTGRNPFQHLVYPLPDRNTMGLGIHATLDLGGQLRFGPDADYVKTTHYDIDANKADYFARAVCPYFPAIEAAKLQPAYAGIRPKLAGPGDAAADFVISNGGKGENNLLQLFGIESPGLTASLALAEEVCERLEL